MQANHNNWVVQTEPRPRYNQPSESDVLLKQVRQHNESSRNKGVKKLRHLLTSVASIREFEKPVKALLHVLNGKEPHEAVKIARDMLEQQYASAEEYFIHSQVAHLVKKYPFKASKDVAEANGLKKFLKAERRNRHMNRLLRNRQASGENLQSRVLHDVRTYVVRVLGSVPPSMKEIAELAGWGPGASVGVTGRFTNFARKFLSERWTCTAKALPYFLEAALHRPEFWEVLGLARWYGDDLLGRYRVICPDVEEFTRRAVKRIEIVDYNKIAFVPKDADCDRTIASEPLCNSWLQLGYDKYIKARLRRFGIDLSRQEPNQERAREGSLHWADGNPYTTADMRNASGSICTMCVHEVTLGTAWFNVLDDLRSKGYRLPKSDNTVEYHGFVSMGNGFCFPLETTIFAACCYAAHMYTGSPKDFLVYGDDIVIRQNEALILQEILRSLGFEINTDKTFVFGPFRESCGTDWYIGEDVRPIVLDTSLESIEERVRFHNALCRLPNRLAQPLSGCVLSLMPPFMSKFVRPFADHTDEAIDGRYLMCMPVQKELREKYYNSPAWYGLSFDPVEDKEILGHADINIALYYAALNGGNSDGPFAERRETHMRVRRFTHSGNTSTWLPLPPRLLAVSADKFGEASIPGTCLANLVTRRMLGVTPSSDGWRLGSR